MSAFCRAIAMAFNAGISVAKQALALARGQISNLNCMCVGT